MYTARRQKWRDYLKEQMWCSGGRLCKLGTRLIPLPEGHAQILSERARGGGRVAFTLDGRFLLGIPAVLRLAADHN